MNLSISRVTNCTLYELVFHQKPQAHYMLLEQLDNYCIMDEDKLNVNFVSDAGGTAEIRLFNASGSMVKRIQSAIVRGDNSLQLQDLNSQAPGFYIANVIINNKLTASLKVLKQ